MIDELTLSVSLTGKELYETIKLYDLLRDTGMMNDLPKEIETFFEKIMDS